jgi:FSR family fosmidomycin resistance protein-like MFS transporter
MKQIRINRTFVQKTALLSIAHAAVDLCCAALFFSVLKGEDLWLGMVLYNACAFLLQLPMGVVADRLNRNMLFAAVGCALVALAFGLRSVPILAMIVAGLGNGAFHVGGGIEVLNGSETKAGPLGVFVSPGAIGLYFGRVFSAQMLSLPWLLPAILLGLGGAILLLGKPEFSEGSHNAPLSFEMPKGGFALLVLLFLVVVLRSFMSTTAAFSTGDLLSGMQPVWSGLIPVLCLALGKTAGGFAADRWKPIPTAIVSLGLCALLLFFPLHPLLALCALFLFNMSMPLTLFASARLLKGAKGTAFGLLTAALFMGVVPFFLGVQIPESSVLFGALAAVSGALLVIGLREAK